MRKMLGFIAFLAVFFSLAVIQVQAETVFKGPKSEVDASHSADGYVNVKMTVPGDKKLKVIVEKDGGKYTYDLAKDGTVNSYPLQLGNGHYKLNVFENVADTKYSVIQTCEFDVTLSSEFAPYLNSNVFVDYKTSSNIVNIAASVTSGCQNDLEKLDKIYSYVAQLIIYDTNKATSVQPGYVPNIDSVLSSKTGICFDYAAVMAAMLRSQNIPTKLVTGYVSPNNAYHAWNEAYIKGIGWVKTGELYFDGQSWKVVDATFLSASQNSPEIQKFIGDGSNYTQKYEY